jgi:hypothetical protein
MAPLFAPSVKRMENSNRAKIPGYDHKSSDIWYPSHYSVVDCPVSLIIKSMYGERNCLGPDMWHSKSPGDGRWTAAKFVPCVKMERIRWSPPTLGARNGLCKSLCLGSINGRSTGGNFQTYRGTAHRDSNHTSNQAGERLDLTRY